MKNVKLTKTLNIEIGSHKLTFSEDEAFELYNALAKVFGPLDDDYMDEDEDDSEEIEEDDEDFEEIEEEDEESEGSDLIKRIKEIYEELEKRENISNPYPLFPSFPKSTPGYSPEDIPKFPQVWCTITHKTK